MQHVYHIPIIADTEVPRSSSYLFSNRKKLVYPAPKTHKHKL